MFGWFVSSFYISKVTKTNLIHVDTKMCCSLWLKNRIGFILVFRNVHTFSFSFFSLSHEQNGHYRPTEHAFSQLTTAIYFAASWVSSASCNVRSHFRVREHKNAITSAFYSFSHMPVLRLLSFSLCLSLVPCVFVLAICKLLAAVIVRKYI